MDDKVPQYDKLKKDIQEVAHTNQSKASGNWGLVLQVLTRLTSESTNSDNENVGLLKRLANEIQDKIGAEASGKEGTKNRVAEKSDRTNEDVNKALSGFKEFLKQALPDNFNIDDLQHDFKKVLKGDKSLEEMLSQDFNINRNEILSALNENTNLDKEKIEEYADKVEEALDKIKNAFSTKNISEVEKQIEYKIKSFLNMDKQESFDTKKLQHEFMHLINNPAESFDTIKTSISNFDTADFKDFLLRNNLVSKHNLDSVTETYESAISEVKEKISDIEIRAHQEWEMTKRKAVINAEHTRKTAAIAAWWLLATILVAGCVSVLGVYTF